MAKTRTKKATLQRNRRDRDILRTTNAPLIKSPAKTIKSPEKSIPDLLAEATTLLEQSQAELALPIVEEALRRLEAQRNLTTDVSRQSSSDEIPVPPVLVLAGETCLSLGKPSVAQSYFMRATSLDPEGSIVSAEPWLWLAQLSQEGGKESISHYSRAADILRREITVLEGRSRQDDELRVVLDEKQSKLADTLCSMTEVYMTDLSWDADAEGKCEKFVTEALAVVPQDKSAGTLQCLANVRISQERFEDAKEALRKSLEIWKDEEDSMPDFASRISLCRLLMEVDMLTEAMVVLSGLVTEDDQSVEAWYLGGWCQILQSTGLKAEDDEILRVREGARQWLGNCLRLYEQQDYEDERLKGHALELVEELAKVLGPEDEAEEDDEEAWQDEDSQEGIDVGDGQGPDQGSSDIDQDVAMA